MIVPRFGRQKPAPIAPPAPSQRSLSDIFSDLEAGDRLREERKIANAQDRRTDDRREGSQILPLGLERRHWPDRREMPRGAWMKQPED